MAEVILEDLSAPAIYVAYSGVLALFAVGRVSGLALDVGHGVTSAVAVYEGYALPHATQRQNLAGEAVSDFLKKSMLDRGHIFATMSERLTVQKMKEQSCYVSQDYEAECKGYKNVTEFQLPDGTVIPISQPRIRCPQLLFDPSIYQPLDEYKSLHSIIHTCVQCCDLDLHRALLNNVVAVGGTSSFVNFRQVLQNKLKSIVPLRAQVHITTPEDPVLCGWQGGSILTELSTFNTQWVTKDNYDEHGPSVVHKNCHTSTCAPNA